MKHKSVALPQIEFIEMSDSDISPLISKCQIKICYVQDDPNRNRTVITKETAKKMAPSVRGAMIVGYYNENKKDFEEHNKVIEIHDGIWEMKDTTQPYGFVAPNAKVWFQKFLDDDEVEREYLVTEGFLWTGVYPECKRAVLKGNNQSMELDEETLDGEWASSDKYNYDFFIINEAIISKLCMLGEDNEPCFEGSQVNGLNYSYKDRVFSMMEELKELLNKGGSKKVFKRYSVTVGDALWSALYSNLVTAYPSEEDATKSCYSISEICDSDEGNEKQKLAILGREEKVYSLLITINDDETYSFGEVVDVTESYSTEETEPQFNPEDIEKFVNEYSKNSGKTSEDDKNKNQSNSEEEKCPECGKPISECTCGGKKKKYSLEEIPEYIELLNNYNTLQADYSAVVEERDGLKTQVASLTEFKANIDKKEKEEMIAKFYMLTDDDKKDVIEHINEYSVDDIEAKLSIICVRNKVSFDLEDKGNQGTMTYNFNGDEGNSNEDIPAWVKAALDVAKKMN